MIMQEIQATNMHLLSCWISPISWATTRQQRSSIYIDSSMITHSNHVDADILPVILLLRCLVVRYIFTVNSIDLYTLPYTLDFADVTASSVPVRLVVTGTRALNDPTGTLSPAEPFTNIFEWSDVQPVNLRYVNLNADEGTSCTAAAASYTLPIITTASTWTHPNSSTQTPPPTAFPPVFTARMEALLASSDTVNSPFTWSQYRESYSIADGSWTFDQNNQVLQAHNAITGNDTFHWYLFNHTANGGGGNWLITPTVYAANSFTPYSCSFAYNNAYNRSPLDYMYEAGLTKLYAMGNATTYVPMYHYTGAATVRGIPVDIYSQFFSIPSATDSTVLYNYTRSIYLIASGWQLAGRANNAISTNETSLPLMIQDVGLIIYLNNNTQSNFSSVVNFFTMFPSPNPFLYSPAAYHCIPFPETTRPWLPALSQLPLSYTATITVASTQNFNTADGDALFNPISLAYTEYYNSSSQQLRVDGRARDVNSVEIIQLTANSASSLLAQNTALDMGAMGYSSAFDAATHPSTVLLSSSCSTFDSTDPTQLSTLIFTNSLSYWYNYLLPDAAAAIYSSSSSTALEQVWSNSYDLKIPIRGAMSAYSVTSAYRFINSSSLLPLSFDYSLETISDDSLDNVSPTIQITVVSVLFNHFTDTIISSNALSASVFPTITGCKVQTDFNQRYADLINAQTTSIDPHMIAPPSPSLCFWLPVSIIHCSIV